jgi:NAD(P)-dependent dehydrogenase (short-subunit alcohol dehydrogenase family)
MTGTRFHGKVVFVSGAAGGIGSAIARGFAGEGARLALTDAHADGLVQLERALLDLGTEVISECFDITRASAIESFLRRVAGTWGRLDCAVNNAGIRSEVLPLADFSEEAYDRLMAINTKSVWLCMKHEIRLMLAQQPAGGAIVNLASGAGIVAVPGAGTYVASKHAVVGLTKSGAADYARHGIRINALCPGYTRTPMALGSLADSGVTEDQVAAALPAGRVAEPDEQAAAVLFLCSDDARYMAGHALVVDGGHSIV